MGVEEVLVVNPFECGEGSSKLLNLPRYVSYRNVSRVLEGFAADLHSYHEIDAVVVVDDVLYQEQIAGVSRRRCWKLI